MANRVSPPLALTAALSLEGNKWGVHLTWRGPPDPGYDQVNIAWGIGTSLTAPMPDSASFDGNPTSYTIHGALPSTSYLFGVEGGVEDGAGGHDFSQWAKIIVATPVAPPSIPPGGREIVFYSRNGAAWMAPLIEDSPGDVRIGNTHQIGGWEGDWKQVVAFNDPVGNPFLLLYKDGAAFAAPVVLEQADLKTATRTQYTIFHWVRLGPRLLRSNSIRCRSCSCIVRTEPPSSLPSSMVPKARRWAIPIKSAVGKEIGRRSRHSTSGGRHLSFFIADVTLLRSLRR